MATTDEMSVEDYTALRVVVCGEDGDTWHLEGHYDDARAIELARRCETILAEDRGDEYWAGAQVFRGWSKYHEDSDSMVRCDQDDPLACEHTEVSA